VRSLNVKKQKQEHKKTRLLYLQQHKNANQLKKSPDKIIQAIDL